MLVWGALLECCRSRRRRGRKAPNAAGQVANIAGQFADVAGQPANVAGNLANVARQCAKSAVQRAGIARQRAKSPAREGRFPAEERRASESSKLPASNRNTQTNRKSRNPSGIKQTTLFYSQQNRDFSMHHFWCNHAAFCSPFWRG